VLPSWLIDWRRLACALDCSANCLAKRCILFYPQVQNQQMQAVRQLEGATGSGPCKLHIRNLHVAMSVRCGLQAATLTLQHESQRYYSRQFVVLTSDI
jgi:hypothetical protein